MTGDESTGSGMIYTVDTNGVVATYDTTTIHPGGIRPEDFEIVPANQDFYACDFPRNFVVKVSRAHLTELVGDLMIVDAGEINPPGELFIVRWDAATTNFIPRRIPYVPPENGGSGLFEHVTFAPLDLPFPNP